MCLTWRHIPAPVVIATVVVVTASVDVATVTVSGVVVTAVILKKNVYMEIKLEAKQINQSINQSS